MTLEGKVAKIAAAAAKTLAASDLGPGRVLALWSAEQAHGALRLPLLSLRLPPCSSPPPALPRIEQIQIGALQRKSLDTLKNFLRTAHGYVWVPCFVEWRQQVGK